MLASFLLSVLRDHNWVSLYGVHFQAGSMKTINGILNNCEWTHDPRPIRQWWPVIASFRCSDACLSGWMRGRDREGRSTRQQRQTVSFRSGPLLLQSWRWLSLPWTPSDAPLASCSRSYTSSSSSPNNTRVSMTFFACHRLCHLGKFSY